MPTPEISQPFPDLPPPKTLAEALERTRLTRTRARDQLHKHRGELIELRKRGESVEGLVRALREIDIVVGNETLRVWFQRELGGRKKRRRASGPAVAMPPPPSPEVIAQALDAARAYLPGEVHSEQPQPPVNGPGI